MSRDQYNISLVHFLFVDHLTGILNGYSNFMHDQPAYTILKTAIKQNVIIVTQLKLLINHIFRIPINLDIFNNLVVVYHISEQKF